MSYGGSQASSGSRKAKNRQYHTVARTSQIDESLFGNTNTNNNNANKVSLFYTIPIPCIQINKY